MSRSPRPLRRPLHRRARAVLVSLAALTATAITAPALPATTPAATAPTAMTPTATTATASGPVALDGVSTPAAAGAGSPAPATAYAFASLLQGEPVRWDPCQPIRWTANLSGAPAGGLAVLQEATARIAAVSGTSWVYAGTTGTAPTSAALARTPAATYPPVVIGWTDGARSDLLRGQPASVLGMARTAWFGERKADGRQVAAIRSGVVALDATDRLPLRGPRSWKAVALHELGHVMGLAHVADRTQLMASVMPAGAADLQAGDQAGLVRLGRAAGCVVVSGSARAVTPPATAPRLSIALSSKDIRAGQTSRVWVAGVPGERVVLHAFTSPSSTYRVVRTGTVNAAGLVSWPVRPGSHTRLYASPESHPDERASAWTVLSVRR